jgi:hypothetical protein
VSDQQSQPHDDQQGTDEPPAHPFAPRPHPALTSDTQMVALGSRRPADALLGGSNGTRWNPGGFPPVETNGHHNGEPAPRHGGAPVPGPSLPGPGSGGPGSGAGVPGQPGSRSPFAPAGDDPLRSAFLPAADEAPQTGFGQAGDAQNREAQIRDHQNRDVQNRDAQNRDAQNRDLNRDALNRDAQVGDGQAGARSPFAPVEDSGPAGAPFAPSPFAPQSTAGPAASASGSASGSAAVTSPEPPAPAAPPVTLPPVPPQPPVARPVSAGPSAAGSAQVPVPIGGRPVSGPPAPAASAVPSAPHADLLAPTRLEPTRLEPTGWATAGPRPAAAGSATVPVSAPGGGRRSRDEPAADEAPPASEAPKRPGDVTDHAITFWSESASAQFRADWHEVKAQFVDDPEAALTRAHDLLTEAVHELTESMLAERDELDPLRGAAKPDTESMRMAMRGYREFLDRILAL